MPGTYTDDAQMTLAIAEVLLSGEPWTLRRLAARIVQVYHRDPHDGYAPRFQQLLGDARDGDELLERLIPDNDKSGAAMRAAPVGLLPSVADVLHHTGVQARITHNTLAWVEAAQAVALAVAAVSRSAEYGQDLPDSLVCMA
ncbi:ADP-ribosylglycohydrolase family protein [Amycolatopsis sp. H20-H5]|uniref:ADP-ribosylglycohydrolase family protein n=1 Tax=Amycolatopsis sp. H20-H5 TaxID=3046309 RepID=UPI002DB6CB17|nr:ADP-ribosylglycohydrolase family protein [Amycolatopsis sp. H20-H5]MEC3978663.1 ADP-ribosylglycohydrolase family protein [Amycolatopsis sp. H20-H5]